MEKLAFSLMNIEHKKLISRIDDLLLQTPYKKVATNFLNQEEQEIAKRYLGKKYFYNIYGGYDNAESCKLYFYNGKFDIVCLKAEYDIKYHELNHRDILGSLMKLSINRNQVGDFFVQDGYIYLYTTVNFAPFLIDNFTVIKRCKVTFDYCEDIVERKIKRNYFEKIISSERIDNIVSVIMNCSRNKAQQIIKDERVKIDHIPIAEISKLCNNDCIISIRGKGRFLYKGVIKATKKDRILVGIEQYV